MSDYKRRTVFDAICSVPDCGRNVRIKMRSLCSTHYIQWMRGEEFGPIATCRKNGAVLDRDDLGRKLCIGCQTHKPEADFAKQRTTADGLQTYCRQCRHERYYASRRTEALDDRRRWTFGLSRGDYDRMVGAQGDRCAICKQPPRANKSWSIDHDHACCPGVKSCGKCVRALLCPNCNTALGMIGDDTSVLRAMIEYLKTHSGETWSASDSLSEPSR